MPQEMLQPLRGIIPPLATPLLDDGELDFAGLDRLVNHVVAGGVHGLFVLGTTGEGPSLSADQRRAVVSRVAGQVDGRAPVLVGISDTSLAESLELARYAADYGCDAVVAAPPYYFPVDQPALVDYFLRLARSSPLPVVLYNMPAVTGLTIAPASLSDLITEPAIVGLKDSSGDLEYFESARAAVSPRVDFPVLVGPEHLLAEALARGGAGGVCGGGNLFPELFTELYDAHVCDDAPRVARAQQLVEQLQAVYAVGGPLTVPTVVACTKAALEARRLCRRSTAPPVSPATPQQAGQAAAIVAELEAAFAAALSTSGDPSRSLA